MEKTLSVYPLKDIRYEVEIRLPDSLGLLSLITGLFASNGISILHGLVGTQNRMALDHFQVKVSEDVDWESLEKDLIEFSQLLRAGQAEQVRLEMNRRIIRFLRLHQDKTAKRLMPIQLEIDQQGSHQETIVDIRAQDTPAFLYELTNALSLLRINIVRMEVKTQDDKVMDRLWLTTAEGEKISSENQLKALQWAILLMKQFTHLLSKVPDPAGALRQITLFGKDLFSREDFDEVLLTLRESQTLEDLSQVLGTSRFLWEEFLRTQHESIFPILADHEIIKAKKEKPQVEQEIREYVTSADTFEEKVEKLNEFKDREMFRIDIRHILRRTSYVGEFAMEFTDLAEVVVKLASELVWVELLKKFPPPMVSDRKKSEYAILALGKFGGQELGYASDLEILFVYEDDAESSSERSQQNLEFYTEFVRLFRKTIHAKSEGVFEIDLRLRPHGKDGPLAASLDLFRNYYSSGASALNYERQALVKLRFIGGSESLSREVLKIRDTFVYEDKPYDFEDALHLRKRQEVELVQEGRINAKYSPGGLLDIEYLVQILQIAYGRKQYKEIRHPNTLKALRALWKVGAIPEGDFQMLRASYIFLRGLINALRIERGNAKDLTIPHPESEEFVILARRVGFVGDDEAARDKLKDLLHKHMSTARDFYQGYIQKLQASNWETLANELAVEPLDATRVSFDELFRGDLSQRSMEIMKKLGFQDIPTSVLRMKRIYPDPLIFEPFALAVDRAWAIWPSVPDPDLAVMHLEHFLEYHPDRDVFWESAARSEEGLSILLRLFGTSSYLSDLLIAYPEYWEWVRDPREHDLKKVELGLKEIQEKNRQYDQIRQIRHRETLRIALAEMHLCSSLSDIYRVYTQLADTILETFLHQKNTSCPIGVIGLGKLGGKELNFSSDIDLLFVASNDCDIPQISSQIQDILNVLKKGGPTEFLYRTDLRLRPHGEEGSLLLRLEDYLHYYRNQAEPWEYQALIKARFVAGNRDLVKPLLDQLQPMIYRDHWSMDDFAMIQDVKRRYEAMVRSRGEERTNIKLGLGGIRDIEFSLQMLQLKHGYLHPEIQSGNIFDVFQALRKTKLIEEKEWKTLYDGYLFLRRVENRLHLFENRQEFNVPQDPIHLRRLAKSLGFRDKSHRTAEEDFRISLSDLTGECREIFERLFYR
ncbi:MAG: hypothetical protein JW893_01535 [Candidatus Omnitrophica bacterium]|nr:hypothetical protein [Candidatus Omnitrophota bacterium]